MGGERTEQLSRASISCHALKTQRARRGKGEGREPVAALARSKPRRGLREIPLKKITAFEPEERKNFSFPLHSTGRGPSLSTNVSFFPCFAAPSNLPTEDEGGGARHPSACLSESPPPPPGSSPFKVRHSAYGGRTTDTEE